MALFAEGKLFREAGTGTGGGDKHNKGYFVDESALTTAYPTAEAGDYAIVESTDTVWVWDSDNTRWVDSDQKGQVTSVNGQTGAVVLAATDVGALPTSGGTMTGTITLGSGANIVANNRLINIGSSQYPISRVYVDTLSGGDQYGRFMVPAADQSTFGFFIALVDPMPTARQDLEAMIFQYMGATDSNYTHGYFYECVTDDNTTYYWKQLNVQPSVKVNTTATLAVADWSSNTQTITVSGVKADSVVFVSPAPASASDYASAGILCTAQAADSLTFSCTQTPSSAIVVNIVCM